ncbi:glutathione S-transferase [Truncatella angustata]|uniref:glutathione transferase n=1 Tax=Truncatella angustata TaxID=152316 RepID=A0A9P8UX21_9PEZI|nr:glutathione S-transferase [Truncatella angustata]KAH6659753.1 glutathione S-transferase [Truncatella angustata]
MSLCPTSRQWTQLPKYIAGSCRLHRTTSQLLHHRQIRTATTAAESQSSGETSSLRYPNPPSREHSDIPSYLSYVERTGLDTTTTTYVGTHYEYTVAHTLERFGFELRRVGGSGDHGIDLLGTWSVPSTPTPLRVLLQCKASSVASTARIGPATIRELEGAFVGAPPGWRGGNVVGLLVTQKTATKGVLRTANPWKVVMILEELGLPYNQVFVDLAVIKQEPFTKINPNGRVPAIEDPNTGITLWESGAIVEYLVDTYDKDHKISSASFPEKYHEKQYLAFQISGQGPYYGQYAWFKMFHPEKVESAIQRYQEETFRVVSVLDNILEGKEYLVGNKASYADIVFIAWEQVMHFVLPDQLDRYKGFKNYWAWFERITARPAIQKTIKLKEEAMAQEAH